MSPLELNRGMQAELWRLAGQQLLTPAQAERLVEDYPVTPWDVAVLIRWLTWLGALAAGAGVVLLAKDLASAVRLAEAGLAAATGLGLFLGHWVLPERGLSRTAAATELLGAMSLEGLMVAVAIDFSTGSGNWPALVAACAVVTLVLAYALNNRLVLMVALANGLVWFAASPSYEGHWNESWDHPARFLGPGALALALAWIHLQAPAQRLRAFSRVYLHVGLLGCNLALCALTLAGLGDRWFSSDDEALRLGLSLGFALLCVCTAVAGSRLGQMALRGYGLTFLFVDLFLGYIQFIAVRSSEAWFLHLLVVGGGLVAVGFFLERQFRSNVERPSPPAAELGD